MKVIKVAAAALNQIPMDWAGNLTRAKNASQEAREAGAQLVCLPELTLSGYGCEDAFHSPELSATALNQLDLLVGETAGMVVSVGLPLFHRGGLYNVVAVIVDGELLGFVAKQNLAGDGVHYEPRWFKPWPAGQVDHVEVGEKNVPVGDLVFEIGGIRVGFEICEDAWSAQRPGIGLARRGVDLILNPSASHFAFDKYDIRKRFVLEGSRAFGAAYVYANLMGNEAGRIVYDGGCLIASEGRIVAEGKRFGFKEVAAVSASVDVDALRMARAKTASVAALDPEDAGVISTPFRWGIADHKPMKCRAERVWSKEEEFSRCVALALFDYMRKTFSKGYVLSLSGGADSSAVAALVKLMVDLALEELGEVGLKEKLAYFIDPAETMEGLRRRVLVCVYQATRNSSDTTQHAAQVVAAGVGADYLVWDVDSLVSQYSETVGASLGRELSWKEHDIALQNIQARARAPGIWMLANLRGGILVSTSNRSEAAVGYATMDGDTCGGLCPLAGIDKAFLLRWLKWCEQCGVAETGPMSFLDVVNQQQPTAELRPAEAAQTDETDLMPYQVLDAIERLAIRDKLMPISVFRMLQGEYPDCSDQQLVEWIERFFNLWCRNQWKRERYAPSFHLDDTNLDPKSWCRFPIISGGYKAELAALKRIALADQKTTTLYRPVGQRELELVAESDYRKWPPRLPEQPIFYPVTNEAYASEIAQKWNTKDDVNGSVGYVTEFQVESEYLAKYDVQKVGGALHTEYWIPAEELDEFNAHIVGKITVIKTFR
jgi:NAD+ synthase (glutamine-hydrolysing)